MANGVINRKECYEILKEQRDYDIYHEDDYKGDYGKKIAAYNLALHDMNVCERLIKRLDYLREKNNNEGLDKIEENEYITLYTLFFNKMNKSC